VDAAASAVAASLWAKRNLRMTVAGDNAGMTQNLLWQLCQAFDEIGTAAVLTSQALQTKAEPKEAVNYNNFSCNLLRNLDDKRIGTMKMRLLSYGTDVTLRSQTKKLNTTL
jgi:hypothetical protein